MVIIGNMTIDQREWPYIVTDMVNGEPYTDNYDQLNSTDLTHIAQNLGKFFIG